MQPTLRSISLAATAALLPCAPVAAQCDPLWSNPWEGGYVFDSYAEQVTGFDAEVADDFELTAEIHRVVAYGLACSGCPIEPLTGVRIRFYEWTPNGPGALQVEHVVAGEDPSLGYDGAGAGAGTFDVWLPEPFQASGLHFLSVQPQYAPNGQWGFWSANPGSPDLSPMWFRDAAGGGDWQPYPSPPFNPNLWNRDANFALFGVDPATPDPLAVCGSWEPVQTPDANDQANRLLGVAAVSPQELWAVGEYETVSGSDFEFRPLAMRWDGSAWSIVPTPCPAPSWNVDCGLSDVDAFSSDYVVAVGDHYHPQEAGQETFVLEWNGSQWEQLASPTQPNGSGSFFGAVEVLAENDFWAVGFWAGVDFVGSTAPLAAHWNGSDWEVFQPPIDPELFSFEWNSLSSLSVLAPDDIWAAGGHLSAFFPHYPYIVHYDGGSWEIFEPRPDPLYRGVSDIHALAPDDVWVSIDKPDAADPISSELVFLHYDGSSWTESPSPGGWKFLGDHQQGLFVVGNDTLARWNGSAWELQATLAGCPSQQTTADAELIGPCEMWSVGGEVHGVVSTFSAHLRPLWADLGGALAGTSGTPQLIAKGALTAGGSVSFEVSDALPQGNGFYVVGFSALEIPLLGGTLVPFPDLLLALSTDAAGQLESTYSVPGFAPGTTLFTQAWMIDPVAAQGASATNAVTATSD